MRNIWYADNRDLAKWSVLIKLAQLYQIKRVLQIAYFRPSEFKTIKIDGQVHQLPKEVISHFRDIRKIREMDSIVHIEVFDKEFEDRKTYHKAVNEYISTYQHEKCIIFLDPDTGLEPKKPGLGHILNSEVEDVWASVKKGDILVFYQHQTNRNGMPWIEEKMEQFSKATHIPIVQVKIAHGESIAKDVVFFFAVKA